MNVIDNSIPGGVGVGFHFDRRLGGRLLKLPRKFMFNVKRRYHGAGFGRLFAAPRWRDRSAGSSPLTAKPPLLSVKTAPRSLRASRDRDPSRLRPPNRAWRPRPWLTTTMWSTSLLAKNRALGSRARSIAATTHNCTKWLGPARMPFRCLLALIDQRLDERVIMGDLDELAVAQQVGPGVADVAECRVSLRPQQRGQGRAHALDRRVGDDQFLEAQVRRRDGVGQRANKVGAGIFRVERCDRRNGGGARHLTGRVATHAVGNREQVRSGVGRVFVPLSEETDIGPESRI